MPKVESDSQNTTKAVSRSQEQFLHGSDTLKLMKECRSECEANLMMPVIEHKENHAKVENKS